MSQMGHAGPDDSKRRFVVSFFMADSTLAVYEPPVRASIQKWRHASIYIEAAVTGRALSFVMAGQPNHIFSFATTVEIRPCLFESSTPQTTCGAK